MAEQVPEQNQGAPTGQPAAAPIAQPAPQKGGGFFSFQWAADAFNGVVGFGSGVVESVNSFLVANPIIKNTLDGVLQAGLYAGGAYLGTVLAPGAAVAFTIAGITGAIGSGVKAYGQHQLDNAHITNITSLFQQGGYNQQVNQALTNLILPILKANPSIAAGIASSGMPPAAMATPAPAPTPAPEAVVPTVQVQPATDAGVKP